MSYAVTGGGPGSLHNLGPSPAPEQKEPPPSGITVTQPEQVSASLPKSGPTQREQDVRQEPRDGSPLHQRASGSKEQPGGGVGADKEVPGSRIEETSTSEKKIPAKPVAPSAKSKAPNLREQIDKRRKELLGSGNNDGPDERKGLRERDKREFEFLGALEQICDKLPDAHLQDLLGYMGVKVDVRDIPTLVELGVSAKEVGDWGRRGYFPKVLTELRNEGLSVANILDMFDAKMQPADAFSAIKQGGLALDAFKFDATARAMGVEYDPTDVWRLAENLAGQAKITGLRIEDLHQTRIICDSRSFAPFKTSELLLLKEAGRPPLDGVCYREAGLAINRSTVIGSAQDERCAGPLVFLKKGGYNKVYVTDYCNPDGSIREVAFKPIKALKKAGRLAQRMGIDPKNPQFTMRNLASSAIDKKLGFNVLVNTGIAIHKLPETGDRKLGLEMERAKGKSAGDWLADAERGGADAKAIFSDPGYWRAAIKLQLTDAVTGQGDRHDDNYFIDDSSGAITVTGIDNDQCFGSAIANPNDLVTRRKDHPLDFGSRGVLLPPVVDTDMVAAINSLTDETLDAVLGDMLKPAEIKATKARVAAIEAHILKLAQEGLVIDPAGWGSHEVKTALFAPVKALNYRSYVHREISALKK